MNESSLKTPTALHAPSEEDLARRVQEGCADSFNELVERLQPRLLFVLRRRLQHQADAEDVAQKTLLRAFEKIDRYDPSRQFSAWLFTIAIRLAADHYRKPAVPIEPTGEIAATIMDHQPDPAQEVIAQERAQDIWALADRLLKPEQWTALWLLYGEGQTVREIAQALGRTAVSVRVLLYRARKTLTPHLAKYSEVENTDVSYSAVGDDEPVDFAAPQIARAEL